MQYWQQLSTREKTLVSLGGAVVALFIMYLLILKPSLDRIEQLKNNIRQQSSLLSYMQTTVTDIQLLKKNEPDNPVFSDGSITSIVELTLNQGALQNVSKQVRQANNQVSVQFNAVPTLDLLNWLSALWQQHRISVVKLELYRTETQGTIRANIDLNRQTSS